MQNEATPIAITQAEDDVLRNTLTVLKEQNGQLVLHRKIDRSKLIDGDDFIIEVAKDE